LLSPGTVRRTASRFPWGRRNSRQQSGSRQIGRTCGERSANGRPTPPPRPRWPPGRARCPSRSGTASTVLQRHPGGPALPPVPPHQGCSGRGAPVAPQEVCGCTSGNLQVPHGKFSGLRIGSVARPERRTGSASRTGRDIGGGRRSAPDDLHAANRALAAPDDQEPPVQQVGQSRPGLLA
jgi:hypothetical protein